MVKRRGEPLMRDLHMLTEGIDAKVTPCSAALTSVQGLREKVDSVSDLITEAEKDKAERVGKVEKDIEAHELQAVEVALVKHKKVPVDAFEIQQLRKLEKEVEQENAKKKQKLNAEVAERVTAAVRFKQLEFDEQYASMQAKEMAFQVERKTLTETIEALRLEIDSQKKLTGDIAKAAAVPPLITRPSGTV